MKAKYLLIGLVLFLVIGEIVLRLDQAVQPFAQDDHIFLAEKISETPEFKMVKANTVPLDDSTFRVMVLGDSYINGWGTDENRKFSNVLRTNLTKLADQRYKRFLVLDASRPGNNTLDNYNEYEAYYHNFKPQVIIIPYNINDVEDNLDTVQAASAKQADKLKHVEKPNFGQKLYAVIYQVHLLQYVMHNFHSFLKSKGIVIPKSELDLQLKSYTQNKENWIKSKEILNRFASHAAARNEKLIVILMPEYNVIDNLSAFNPTYQIIQQFFTGKPATTYINPVKYFVNYPKQDLRVSKYDGHPSILAHRILADSIAVLLKNKVMR